MQGSVFSFYGADGFQCFVLLASTPWPTPYFFLPFCCLGVPLRSRMSERLKFKGALKRTPLQEPFDGQWIHQGLGFRV